MSIDVLKGIVKTLGITREKVISLPEGGGSLEVKKFEVDPYDFIRQAEEDYETGGRSADLNAITNAKRAIISQIDQILFSFGYIANEYSVNKKLELVKSLGIVAPRILKKVTDSRNLLEHEYKRPEKNEIEEALDLASLIIASIKPILLSFEDEFIIANKDEQIADFTFYNQLSFSMSYVKEEAVFKVCGIKNDKDRKYEIVGETKFKSMDKIFPIIVQLALATSRDYKLDIALNSFFKALE